MSEPGLGEYVTAMQRHRSPILKDDISNNNPLYASMEEYDGIESYPGGRSITEDILFDENDTYQRYYGAQILNTLVNPVLSGFEYDHKQIAIAVLISGREELMNSGPDRLRSLVTTRVKAAEYTFANNFQADMSSNGTASSGLQIGGIQLGIASVPTTGTIGGIDRSTTAGIFARNTKFDTVNDVTAPAPGGAATTAATIRPYLDYCINQTTRNMDRVKILYMGQGHYQFLQTALQAMQRVTAESNTVKAGYKTLMYEGIPCFCGGGVNFGLQTQLATDRTYGINTRFTKLRYHVNANMEPLPEVQSINQHAKCKLMIWMGNMTWSAPRLDFVMFDS